MYPSLKSDGSIEASAKLTTLILTCLYPSLKSDGSIEASIMRKPMLQPLIKYPSLKSDGSIEAYPFLHLLIIFTCCIHRWKAMALLKQSNFCHPTKRLFCVSIAEKRWLYWSGGEESYRTAFLLYPSLKSDGSIEALSSLCVASVFLLVSIAEKRWLYWSCSYVIYYSNDWDFATYPSLKSDGSIEARRNGCCYISLLDTVSIAEKRWLYWSYVHTPLQGYTLFTYPSLKSDGSIEAIAYPAVYQPATHQYPSLKSDGSIEASYSKST